MSKKSRKPRRINADTAMIIKKGRTVIIGDRMYRELEVPSRNINPLTGSHSVSIRRVRVQ